MPTPPRKSRPPDDDPLETLRKGATRRPEPPGKLAPSPERVREEASEILADVAVAMASSGTLTDVLNLIVDGIMRVTGCARGFVMLRESDGDLTTFTGRYTDRSEWNEKSARNTSRTVRDRVVQTREPIVASDLSALDDFKSQNSIQQGGLLAAVCLPMLYKDALVGVIYADSTHVIRNPLAGMTQLLDAFALQAALAVERARSRGELERRQRAKEAGDSLFRLGRMVSREPAMGRLFAAVQRIAEEPLSVLIQGETGTGKEILANAIHDASPRADRRFVSINAGGMPDELVSSILFGHKRGAFTSAVADRDGLFELADGGTLFLDEVGEMPLATQIKLLRVLADQQVARVGDEGNPRQVDVRVIAATHVNLAAAVIAGAFREDLLNRLRQAPLFMPPLRERRSDIIPLALEFIERYAAKRNIPVPELTPEAAARLRANLWSGNIRMLKAAVELSVAFRDENNVIGVSAIDRLSEQPGEQPAPGAVPAEPNASLKVAMEAFECDLIRRRLEENDFNVSRTAEALELSRQMLHQKIRKYGIKTRED